MGTVPEDHSLVLRNNFLPMVTYASMVWWPRVEAKGTKSKLQKLQRLACLSITGAMTSCPTVALEAMLGLTPLWLEKKDELPCMQQSCWAEVTLPWLTIQDICQSYRRFLDWIWQQLSLM